MTNPNRKIYLFTGVPGSGKSTLAKAFANERKMKFVSKDEQQLKLFIQQGFNSSIEKKSLVQKADRLVIEEIKEFNKDLVIDKFVRDEDFINYLSSIGTLTIIYVYATPRIIAERYNARRLLDERIPFETIDVYPFRESESHLFPPIDEERIKGLLDKETILVDKYPNVIRIDNSNLSCVDELELLNKYGI